MERNEVSLHEITIWQVFTTNPSTWMTNSDVEQKCSMLVSRRTVRLHTLRLVKLGVLDQAEVFPAHRYRLAEKASKRNTGYDLRLKQAAEVFGVNLIPPSDVPVSQPPVQARAT